MIVDKKGYRHNVGIVLTNAKGHVFIGRRIGHDTWQFPQGGVQQGESPEQAMFRELKEEVGLDRYDVSIIGRTKHWLTYRLPKQYIRRNTSPVVIGQKQIWFCLALRSSEQKIRLNISHSPEFDSWRWVDFWQPVREVIYFKRQIYRDALKELEPMLKQALQTQSPTQNLPPEED